MLGDGRCLESRRGVGTHRNRREHGTKFCHGERGERVLCISDEIKYVYGLSLPATRNLWCLTVLHGQSLIMITLYAEHFNPYITFRACYYIQYIFKFSLIQIPWYKQYIFTNTTMPSCFWTITLRQIFESDEDFNYRKCATDGISLLEQHKSVKFNSWQLQVSCNALYLLQSDCQMKSGT